ncbi:hypothetical protein M6B38_316805 [Iris pallida]|uniref:Uncharacterized protein n=1 Tax=Iris pallida TaxID=29817 RepID=A0AAX6HDX9_IRIPA|nr:hypothetical protein M6B38_316805 [Iris pallida]
MAMHRHFGETVLSSARLTADNGRSGSEFWRFLVLRYLRWSHDGPWWRSIREQQW